MDSYSQEMENDFPFQVNSKAKVERLASLLPVADLIADCSDSD